jgi:hypothetical protein
MKLSLASVRYKENRDLSKDKKTFAFLSSWRRLESPPKCSAIQQEMSELLPGTTIANKGWRLCQTRVSVAYVRLALLLVSSLAGVNSLFAQRLDAVGKEEPLTVSGSISSNFIFYNSSGQSVGRDPLTSYLSGSLNFDIYGVSMPLTFSWSSQSTGAFQQPFNQVAIHPTYKWVTAHIGFTSMSFSSHSLSGHTFRGVGVDLTPPGRFKISAMGGELLQATPASTLLNGPEIVPAYRRWGGGFKVGYALDKHAIDLIVFKAKDDARSIPEPPSATGLKPKDNLVVGLNLSSRITDKLALRLETTLSALTNDTRLSRDSAVRSSVPDLGGLLKSNGSTALYKALKAGVDYSFSQFSIGLGYERIDPEYQSLGGYYFTNDLENVTANFAARFLKDKAQLSLNVGKQRDNLNNKKASSFSNWVGAANLTVTPSDKVNLNLSYSSFQAYTHIRSAYEEATKLTPYDNLDTLKFTQISQNMAANATYKLSASNEQVQMLTLSGNAMLTSEKQGGKSTAGDGGVYTGMMGYSLSLVPIKTSINAGVNLSYNNIANAKSTMIGPSLGVARGFLDGKLNSNLGLNYSLLRSGGATSGSVLNTRMGMTYSVGGTKEKPSVFTHQLGLSVVYSNRFKSAANAMAFSDFTLTFSYTCNLAAQKYWLGTKKAGNDKKEE